MTKINRRGFLAGTALALIQGATARADVTPDPLKTFNQPAKGPNTMTIDTHSLGTKPAGKAGAEIAQLSHQLDLTLPDSRTVSEAYDHAREISDPWLFYHVLRSWLFSAQLAARRQLKPNAEVLAVSALLHDIGLTPVMHGQARFEVVGAIAASRFAAEHGMGDRDQRLIWDSIALHTTPSLALHKETEVSCCLAGIGLDVGGQGYDDLGRDAVEAIVRIAPRLAMKENLKATFIRIARDYPETTYDNALRDFGQHGVPGYKAPSGMDYLLNGPFAE